MRTGKLKMIMASFASEIDNGSISGTATIDWGDSNKQKATLGGDCTITFTAPPGPCQVTLKCVNFGAYNPTFSPVPKWPGGTEPTWTSSGTDILSLYWDGSNYYGQAGANFS